MQNIFEVNEFVSPYKGLRFPGMAEDEKILYVTRESPIMMALRLAFFSMVVSVLIAVGSSLLVVTGNMLKLAVASWVTTLIIVGAAILLAGFWWIWQVYRKTVFIITTRRLTKFIHTTPWNRYQMSLGLDKVEDSGAYSKGYAQAMFGLGTFVARSSAGNIKNFKIVNISYAEDLHNWMNKLMFTFNKEQEKLDSFRPFVQKGSGKRD